MTGQSEQAEQHRRRGIRRRVFFAVFFTLLAIAATTTTVQLAGAQESGWLVTHKTRIIAAEIGFFGIFAVESIVALAVGWFDRAGALQTGIAIRATVRVICYLVLLVSIVSILSSNPALAIGVGGVTGVVVAFSAQNLVGNAFAGMFLAMARPFKVGDEITVMGLTGKVADIRVMHTQLDLGDRIALVPNNVMFTQALQRKNPPVEGEEADESH